MFAKHKSMPMRRPYHWAPFRGRKCWLLAVLTLLLMFGAIAVFTTQYPADPGSGLTNPERPSGPTKSFPTGLQPGSEEAQRHLSFTEADEDRLPLQVREGEKYISHIDFLNCLAKRLAVDVASRTQMPLDADTTIPLFGFPFMMELTDHRALMCGMDASIRYLMYVDNGGLPEVGRLFDDIEAVFGWTGRVVVRRYPWNAGFSAAVNSAIDWALRLPAAEVPFIQISNHDVRYPGTLLSSRTRVFHELVRGDGARIAALEAEVAAESVAPDVLSRYANGRPLRSSWSLNATLVTSALLPDRIRYMPYLQRQQQFANHTGTSLFQSNGGTSAFCMSRLALLTVGYWDENFYPAYFEDIDYFWRVDILGFQQSIIARGEPESVHYLSAMYRMPDVRKPAFGKTNVSGTIAPHVQELLDDVKRAVRNGTTYRYALTKWDSGRWFRARGTWHLAEPYLNGSRLPLKCINALRTAQADAKSALAEQYTKQQSGQGPESRTESRLVSAGAYCDGLMKAVHNDHRALPLDAWVGDHKFRLAVQYLMRRQPLILPLTGEKLTCYYNISLHQGIFASRPTEVEEGR